MMSLSLRLKLQDMLKQLPAITMHCDGDISFLMDGHIHVEALEETIQTVITAIENDITFNEWIHVGESSHRCWVCGERLDVFCNGTGIKFGDECSVEYAPYSAKISIPSGKMFMANNLRDLVDIVGYFDVNTHLGQRLTFEAYAKVGMAHGFVGNTCPAVRQKNKRTIHLADSYKMGRLVDHIGTDLWWYSIMDYDFAQKQAEKKGMDWNDLLDYGFVVDVKPGVYEITHYYPMNYDYNDWKSPRHFASLIYVEGEECSEPFDAGTVDLDIGQVIHDSMTKYPTLYCTFRPPDAVKPSDNTPFFEMTEAERKYELSIYWEQKKIEELSSTELMQSCMYVADHIFFTLSGGHGWHPNGWTSENAALSITPDLPSVEVPQFMGVFGCYGYHEGYSALDKIANGKIIPNESFVRCAFNVCQCCLIYGIEIPRQPDLKDDVFQRMKDNNLEKIRSAFFKLAEMYPQWIPDYCRPLLEQQ